MAKKKNITKMKCPSVFNQNEGQTNAHKIKCRVLIVCEGLKTEPNYSLIPQHFDLTLFIST